jgi:Uma2 family endonuclease
MSCTAAEKLYTYDEIENLSEGLYEIIDGRKVDVSPTGFKHGIVAGKIYQFLYKHIAQEGFLAVGEVGILISRSPLRIRGADLVFVSHKKIEKEPSGILQIAPDLVIEIISPSNTPLEVNEKIKDYLKIGVGKIILIYPELRKITLFASRGEKNYSYDDVVEIRKNITVKFSEILSR